MRLFCLCLIIPIALAAAPRKKESHAAALKVAQNPAAALELAGDAKDPYLALAAFGNYLKQGDAAADSAKVARVARRRDFDDRGALLLAAYKHQKLVDALVGNNDELAASILAIAALKDHLVAQRAAEPIGAKAELDKAHMRGGNKGKGRGKGKASGAAASIPVQLFASRDPVVLSQAILAAAYRKDSSHAEAIKAVRANSAEVMGAKLLYQAMT